MTTVGCSLRGQNGITRAVSLRYEYKAAAWPQGDGMDWQAAIHYAQLVQAAERIPPDEVCGATLTVALKGQRLVYTVLTSVFANDLATEHNKDRKELIVSIGFVAQDEAGNVVIAIRGTHGIHEWLHDCLYFAVECPFLAGAGKTEDGFTQMYQSLRTGRLHDSPRLREAFAAMTFPLPIASLTLCGHSLGAAVATLLALDLVANTRYKDLSLYTFASPRTGDDRFAETFNRLVPRTFRIANRLDLVTEVPPGSLSHISQYRHVEATAVLVPDHTVGHHIFCMHHLTTYLYLMAAEAGLVGEEYALCEECRQENEHPWFQWRMRAGAASS